MADQQTGWEEHLDAILHQWKQPLNFLLMLHSEIEAEFQEALKSDPLLSDLIREGREKISHLSRSINALRMLAKRTLDETTFSPGKALEELQLVFEKIFAGDGLKIQTEVFPPGLHCEGASARFQQTVLELLIQSREMTRAAQRQGVATISVREEGDRWLMEYRDDIGGVSAFARMISEAESGISRFWDGIVFAEEGEALCCRLRGAKAL